MPELPEVEVVKKSLSKAIYDLSIENIIAIALIIFGIFIVYLLENTNTNK